MNDPITMTIELNDEIDLSITNATGTTNYQKLSNKPSINDITLVGNKTSEDLGIQNVITSENKLSSNLVSGLSNVAISGSYDDLTNKPTIPDVSNFITKDVDDLTYYTKTSNLSNVATSGNYNDLSYKPTIPTNSDFTLSGLSEKSYTNLTDKPTIPDISGKEDTSNKVTSLSSQSTDTQYPSAKCVYDALSSAGGGSDTDIKILKSTSSSSYPLVLSTLKKGFYLFDDTSTNDFTKIWYKWDTTSQVASSSLTTNQKVFMCIYKTIEEAASTGWIEIGYIGICERNVMGGYEGRLRYLSLQINKSNSTAQVVNVGNDNKQLKVWFLTNNNQYIQGLKTFGTTPQIETYSAPTNDTDLVAKKYVDDQVGNINTILATLTTPSNE